VTRTLRGLPLQSTSAERVQFRRVGYLELNHYEESDTYGTTPDGHEQTLETILQALEQPGDEVDESLCT
jgi:hypothetical protein